MASIDACRICGARTLRIFQAREMMFGLRERFDYAECASCGCLQICAYPNDIARHYPAGYYSFADAGSAEAKAAGRAQMVRRRLRDWMFAHIPGLRSAWLRSPATQRWLAAHPVVASYTRLCAMSDRILDVGCGSGTLPRQLRDVGFHRAEGADPFIAAPVSYGGLPLVRKARLDEIEGPFDCVSLHHALEHMPDQQAVFRELRRLLVPGGLLMIRIPVAGGMAWREYGADWVQLDPPRHFYIHSLKSLDILARSAGFSVESVEYDSFGLQFWGSELYRRDIPLMEQQPPSSSPRFSDAEMARFEAQAAELNAARDGDQIIALLR